MNRTDYEFEALIDHMEGFKNKPSKKRQGQITGKLKVNRAVKFTLILNFAGKFWLNFAGGLHTHLSKNYLQLQLR